MNKFKITIDGNNYDVTVNLTDHHKANVEVNGISYDVSYESKNINFLPGFRQIDKSVLINRNVITGFQILHCNTDTRF